MLQNGELCARANTAKWRPSARERVRVECCKMASCAREQMLRNGGRLRESASVSNAAKWRGVRESKYCEMAAVCERARRCGMLQNGEVCARANAAKWRPSARERVGVECCKTARCAREQMLRKGGRGRESKSHKARRCGMLQNGVRARANAAKWRPCAREGVLEMSTVFAREVNMRR